MEDEEYEHDGPLDETAFRKWAYDWNMVLMSQDEDLLIGQPSDYSVWFDILKDTDCPKFGYIIGCIDYHLKYLILRRMSAEAEVATLEAVQHCSKIDHPESKHLADRLMLRLRVSQQRGTRSREQAIEMGRILLICKNQTMEEVVVISQTPVSWIVGQRNTTIRLSVNRLTGAFRLVD